MRSAWTAVAAGVALGAVAAFGAAGAAADTGPGAQADQAPPAFNVVSTTKVGSKPGRLTYGYGATWTLNGDGSVSRVDATTHAVKTVKLGPEPARHPGRLQQDLGPHVHEDAGQDLPADGRGRPGGLPDRRSTWVRRPTRGPARRTAPTRSASGSGYVWAAGVKTWQKLAKIDPDTSKVTIKTWPIPAAFTAAASALWMVTPNQASIQKRNPSNLSIQTTLKVSGFTGGSAQSLWLTYGANFLWLSSTTPNDDGAIAKVSPTTGLVPGAVSSGLDIGLTCTAAGAGAVWATQRPDGLSGTPALLFRLSQTNLKTVASGTLPIGANPGAVQCVTVGGGLVYVTDGRRIALHHPALSPSAGGAPPGAPYGDPLPR